jgi:hypothetical protein
MPNDEMVMVKKCVKKESCPRTYLIKHYDTKACVGVDLWIYACR